MANLAQAGDASKYAALYTKLRSSGLSDYRQFILWIPVPNQVTGRTDKKPVNPHTGKVHDAHDRSIWVDLQTACERAQRFNCGVGFVITPPLFFIDIDHCYDPVTKWSPVAKDLCAQFEGAYIEVSHSGRGLHIIGSYHGVLLSHSNKNLSLGLELYTDKRFVALTGWCDG